ncbi:winged helix-turn-helix domain-containing protein [Umezawaea sp. Da 62-37]|uniref:winged helix-turn-helix domain-containing protein n=1 Tax=Umezawaea sp. Da 62-37 TaxID=3075927 RepID=UPI0028F734F0|nr:winged helix-turn-helix domain-containing protein [Umezawaea sp. Da 62-37]WNV82899.1 winged helix-turn-helix domain-containing protein [Umezawaea sp. Da 62-37]
MRRTEKAGSSTLARSAQARYLQVADDLMSQMVSGTLKVGDALPSTSALTRQYQASATVVRSAIRELSSAGLVEGQPGKAVYVIALPHEPATRDGREYPEIRTALTKLTRVVEDLAERVARLEAKDKA